MLKLHTCHDFRVLGSGQEFYGLGRRPAPLRSLAHALLRVAHLPRLQGSRPGQGRGGLGGRHTLFRVLQAPQDLGFQSLFSEAHYFFRADGHETP